MNSEHVKGSVKDIKGKAKEEIGHVTGNSKMAGEGIGEQVAGKVQKAWGDLKDKVKEKVDQVLEHGEESRKSAKH